MGSKNPGKLMKSQQQLPMMATGYYRMMAIPLPVQELRLLVLQGVLLLLLLQLPVPLQQWKAESDGEKGTKFLVNVASRDVSGNN
jgi:hypothetical protein